MKLKYIIIFLLCLLALAASEYLFLSEVNSHQRVMILFPTIFIALISIITIFVCYRRLIKEV